jgi:proline iminopeptidase
MLVNSEVVALPTHACMTEHYFSTSANRTYYPAIEPYRTGFLKVSESHTLYWEESGNPQGQPILFLHGGPGKGTTPFNRRYFDPQFYRIILFDQRGSGKSIPYGSLQENTTWDLVEDMEKLRSFLQIEQWSLFGGSWGSTLALSYAQAFPEHVQGLILWGIFFCNTQDLQWFYQKGAKQFFPQEWEKFIAPIPAEERSDLINGYYKQLVANDSKQRQVAAQSWAAWEASAAKLQFDPQLYASFTEQPEALARIECHYFKNKGFFNKDDWFDGSQLKNIPGIIIHGRYDMICPVENAWKLHKAWPCSQLMIIPNAGHAPSEPGTLDALIRATDSFRLER